MAKHVDYRAARGWRGWRWVNWASRRRQELLELLDRLDPRIAELDDHGDVLTCNFGVSPSSNCFVEPQVLRLCDTIR